MNHKKLNTGKVASISSLLVLAAIALASSLAELGVASDPSNTRPQVPSLIGILLMVSSVALGVMALWLATRKRRM